MRRGVAVLLVLLALTGCVRQQPERPILSEDERVGIRAQLEGQARERLMRFDSSAEVPGYDFFETVADHDWPAVVTACLYRAGFTVLVQGSDVDYAGGTGTQAEFAATRYRCVLEHPRLSSVAVYFTKQQLGALYDYYTGFVVPCLRLHDATVTEPPERQHFIDTFFAFEWHPFDVAWSTTPGDPRVAELEAACPPVPRWADLGSRE